MVGESAEIRLSNGTVLVAVSERIERDSPTWDDFIDFTGDPSASVVVESHVPCREHTPHGRVVHSEEEARSLKFPYPSEPDL